MISNGLTSEKKLLIDDWFKRRFRYDLKIITLQDSASIDEKTQFIKVEVESRRFRMSDLGIEEEVKFDEEIIIGLYNEFPDNNKAIADFRKVRLSESRNTLLLEVNQLPQYVVLDPQVTRLDKNIGDNYFKVFEE